MKYQITLDTFEFEALLKIAAEAQEDGKLQWSMTDTITEATKIIYEPEKKGA